MVSVGIGSLVSIGEWRRARRGAENTG